MINIHVDNLLKPLEYLLANVVFSDLSEREIGTIYGRIFAVQEIISSHQAYFTKEEIDKIGSLTNQLELMILHEGNIPEGGQDEEI